MARKRDGIILRIERTSIHDGKGLRVVVFLKGCPLSCKWCSTPESQQADIENGYGRVLTVDQVVEEICKDEIFFFHSGGGVTVSGGECLLQPDFVAGVLEECLRRGINTAIETSLFAPWESVQKALPYLNTIYVDLKHPDGAIHEEFVGVDNSLILTNLEKLDHSNLFFDIHLRIPLIPGINDEDDILLATLSIQYLSMYNNSLEISLHTKTCCNSQQNSGLVKLGLVLKMSIKAGLTLQVG